MVRKHYIGTYVPHLQASCGLFNILHFECQWFKPTNIFHLVLSQYHGANTETSKASVAREFKHKAVMI